MSYYSTCTERLVNAWGEPDFATTEELKGVRVDVLGFMPDDDTGVRRISTVGVGSICTENGDKCNYELYMAIPRNFADSSFTEVSDFLLSIAMYSQREDVNFQIGKTIPETPLMPGKWAPRAILIDEPRGEQVDMAEFYINERRIWWAWIIPIYGNEYSFIHSHGLDKFDERESQSEWSIADPRRPSVV